MDRAPDDLVSLQTSLRGFAPCKLEIAGGAPPRTVTLKAENRVTGQVTDTLTGKPIPLFTIIPIDVFPKGNLHAERNNAKVGKDGRLNYGALRSDIPLRLRIEATGYRTQTGPEFRVGDDTPRTQNFRLQPNPPISGLVHDATGHPVAKAEVLMATPTEVARTGDFGFPTNGHTAITDAGGHFSFPNPGESFTMLVQADAGFAMATFPAGQYDVGRLRLQPWASVRGQFRDGGQPIEQARFYLDPVRLYDDGRPMINAILHSNTDADGRFTFPRVPPVPVSLSVGLSARYESSFRSGPSVPLDLKPGQQVELDLGGGPTIVKGKVTLTGKLPADLDCTYSDNYFVLRAPGIAPPPELAAAGFDVRKGWRSTWRKSIEGLVYLKTLRHWFVKLAPDGAFRISGVPPGEYDLAIAVYAKPRAVDLDDLRAHKVVRVTVTAEDAARGELTLPEIAATVVPAPGVGDAPTLSFERADGAPGALHRLPRPVDGSVFLGELVPALYAAVPDGATIARTICCPQAGPARPLVGRGSRGMESGAETA